MFSGFDGDDTFVGFNEFESMQRVFNEDVNCNKFPNTHLFDNVAKKISFSYGPENTNSHEREIYTYKIDNDFNDFVAYFNSGSKFYETIILKINKNGLYDSFEQKLNRITELSDGDAKMIKVIKKTIGENDDKGIQYYNPSYNRVSKDEISSDKYNFDKSKNAYILIKKQEKGDSYHDLNTIYKYNRIQNEKNSTKKIKVIKKTLFHYVCK